MREVLLCHFYQILKVIFGREIVRITPLVQQKKKTTFVDLFVAVSFRSQTCLTVELRGFKFIQFH